MSIVSRNKNKETNCPFSIEDMSVMFGIDKELIQILVNRGCDTDDKIRNYLSDSKEYYHNPFMITDMRRAVDRINYALENNEQITIWGDYDVDGTSASSILLLAIKGKGYKTPNIYLPDRHKEGYGLNEDGMKKIVAEGSTKLLITVDCGITSKSIVEKFVENGIDVIVTDHHEVPEEIPYCTAVIDTKRPSEKYPFKELCGAGIAFKLVQALFGEEYAEQFVDIASFATVADVVPLEDENRIIVKRGLKLMNENPRLGFKKLIEKTCSEGEILNAYHYGFRLGPAVNACGRLAHAKYALALMVSNNEEQAEKLASWMKGLNDIRKEIEDSIKEKSFEVAEKYPDKRCLISFGEGWNSGVIGIVASRVTEEFYKPSIVFSYDKNTGIYKGSARSIPGISIYEALKFSEEYILKWGGHEAAAGLSVEAKNFNMFCKTIESYMSRIDKELFTQKFTFDTSVSLSSLNQKLVEDIKIFEPCGVGNPSITFCVKNADIVKPEIIGKNKNHFSCDIRDLSDNSSLRGIMFNELPPTERADVSVLYKPQINEFNGKTSIQLSLKKIIPNKKKHYDVEFLSNAEDISLKDLSTTSAKEKQFNEAGIFSLKSLLDYLPKNYKDYRHLTPSCEWKDGGDYAIVGTVVSKDVFKSGNGFYLRCRDDKSDYFMVMFFNQNYAYNQFYSGRPYFFSGKVNLRLGQMPSLIPSMFSKNINEYQRLMPVYKKVKGMSSSYLEEKMLLAMRFLDKKDILTEDILNEYNLITKPEAIMYAHRPDNWDQVEMSQKRYLFDELFAFAFNLGLAKNEKDNSSDIIFKNKDILKSIKESLPYELTKDQSTAIDKMVNIINSGKRLNSLLQGDVGCGKTIVSLLLSALSAKNGYQASVIAPTEVLAKQHFDDFSKTLEPFGINVGYLVGSTKTRDKKSIYKGLSEGSIDIVVGTHALLQDKVEFKNLGLLIVDEQHKFGVSQREKLEKLNKTPHVVTMSATPIPRTLSMAMFGAGIEVITINEKPAGRKPIITQIMKNDSEVNNFMLEEIRKGHQCYVVCPLIDESSTEKMANVESVTKAVEKIKKWFSKYPTIKISDISGKMKKKDIEFEINKFKNNESQILISTTIVEVGVNVPNSTVMVLKNSERFGLAQAHQLRGRVGRGSAQGYMILQTSIEDEKKAKILVNNSDGFEISKEDMKLRGTGDFLGTKQSGQNGDVVLMIQNEELFKQIEKTVEKILSNEKLKNFYEEVLKK